MRRPVLAVSLSLAACGIAPGSSVETTGRETSPIIGGTRDSGDASVLELFFITEYAPSACSGGACLQGCYTAAGTACTSGTGCRCGTAATCTGELIGPHTVLTAGHCTDVTAGGEITGPGGPAITICTSSADATAVVDGRPTSNGCNLAAFVLFNNRCTANSQQDSCETDLISAGDYVIGQEIVNPGYNANAFPPYTATNNDNDIGLVRLESTTLANGGAEPPLLAFNRKDLGGVCTDLGSLTFAGYGITDPDAGKAAPSGIKYTVTHDVRVKDTWHNEEDGAVASQSQTCGLGTGNEPTCSGDSGGPSFNSAGVIIGITTLGDPACVSYGQDTRVDAYQSWIDTTMTGWGEPINGTEPASDGGAPTGDSGAHAGDAGARTGDGGAGTAADGSVGQGCAPSMGAGDGGDDAMLSPLDMQGSSSGNARGGGGCGVSPSRGPAGGEVATVLAIGAVARRRRRRGAG